MEEIQIKNKNDYHYNYQTTRREYDLFYKNKVNEKTRQFNRDKYANNEEYREEKRLKALARYYNKKMQN